MKSNNKKTDQGFSAAWWVLLAAVLLSIILMLIPKPVEVVDPKILPWNSVINEQGNIEALGLTLGVSTPQDAIALYGEDYETLVFTDKSENNKVAEVYFPTMTLAKLRGVVTLILEVPENELSEMYSRGVKITVNSAGNRQITLRGEDSDSLIDNTILTMTYVPKKNLSKDMITMRFGEPNSKSIGSDGLERWHYPDKGLEIILNPDGPEVLQYYIAQE